MSSSDFLENEEAKSDQIFGCESLIAATKIDEDIEDDDELKIGMKVYSEDEAHKLYCKYAIQKGFDVRKGTIRYGSGGIIRQREYKCSKSGFYLDGDPVGPKKVKRAVKRSGCNAFVRFSVKDGVWEISHFSNEHNHEFLGPEDTQFLKIKRNIDVASASVIGSMVDAGIRGVKTYSYLAKEVGGAENVGFTKRDCQNFINRRKMNLIERGDAQSVMTHFKQSLAKDHMFFHSELLDEDRRLANFFWRDGRSKLDYDCFGDVMIFDTTYRTNKYNMIFAPFVGINHHRKNIFLGCAFLLDETTETFIWLFETFLEAMNNQPPKTIYTDQCQAMANAIKKVFPNTCHRLCSWHISKNATQKIGSLYANCEFRGLFSKCLYDCETELEFESIWNEIITRFDLAGNKWLKALYVVREKWCPAFSLGMFTIRMSSTQRSESMNNVLHQISCKTMNLTEFLHHYEEQCEKMRLEEREEDVRCEQATPQLQVRGSRILMQAANAYTITIYYLFEHEFLSSLTVHLEQVSCVGALYTYNLFQEGHNRHHIIEFNTSNSTVICSCKMFESMGWLCRHALKVLNEWNIAKIPTQYFLNRWLKCAKERNVFHENGEVSSVRKSSLTIERNNLVQLASRAISHLVMTSDGKKVAKKKVTELWEEAERSMKSYGSNKYDETSLQDEMPVLDPLCVREKGVTNARKKSYLEKKKKRKQKGDPIHIKSGRSKPTNDEGSSQYPVSYHLPTHPFVMQTTNGYAQIDPQIEKVPSHNQTVQTTNGYAESDTRIEQVHSHNQDFNLNWPTAQPTFSFTRMLQSEEQIPHFTQDSFFQG